MGNATLCIVLKRGEQLCSYKKHQNSELGRFIKAKLFEVSLKIFALHSTHWMMISVSGNSPIFGPKTNFYSKKDHQEKLKFFQWLSWT